MGLESKLQTAQLLAPIAIILLAYRGSNRRKKPSFQWILGGTTLFVLLLRLVSRLLRRLDVKKKEDLQSIDDQADPFERLESWGFTQQFEVVSKIADSTYGQVFICHEKSVLESAELEDAAPKNSKELTKVAVKVVPKAMHPLFERTQSERCMSECEVETSKRESRVFCQYMRTLLRLDHKNVVKYLRLMADVESYYFVMEPFTGGTLVDRVVEVATWTEDDVRNIMHQVLAALAHVHHVGLVHRDVKPENLVFENKDPKAPLRLVDFGIGCLQSRAEGIAGTLGYAAPEMLGGGRYGPEVDCFSAGVVMAILISGEPPFPAPLTPKHMDMHQQALYTGLDFSKPPYCDVSPQSKGLLAGLLQPSPSQRLSAQEALVHPWFASAKVQTTPLRSPAMSQELNFLRVIGCWSGSCRNELVKVDSMNTVARRGSSSAQLDTIAELDYSIDADKIVKDICNSLLREMPVAAHVAKARQSCPIMGVSRGWEEVTGYKSSDVLGRSFTAVCLKMDDELHKRINYSTGVSVQASQDVVTVNRRNGEPLSTLLHLTPFDVCSQTFFLGVLLDVNSIDEEGDNKSASKGSTFGLNFALHTDTVVRRVHSSIRHWLQRRSASLPVPLAFAIPSQSAKGAVGKFLPSVDSKMPQTFDNS